MHVLICTPACFCMCLHAIQFSFQLSPISGKSSPQHHTKYPFNFRSNFHLLVARVPHNITTNTHSISFQFSPISGKSSHGSILPCVGTHYITMSNVPNDVEACCVKALGAFPILPVQARVTFVPLHCQEDVGVKDLVR